MDGGESGKVFENPPQLWAIASMLIVSSILIVASVLDSSDTFFIWLILAFIPLIVVWRMEFLHKPNSVIIQSDGILLVFRYHENKKFEWKELEWININRDANRGIFGRLNIGGMLKISKHLSYPISQQIGNIIIHEYNEMTGKHLPIKPGVVPWN